jgi:hypothetical protein
MLEKLLSFFIKTVDDNTNDIVLFNIVMGPKLSKDDIYEVRNLTYNGIFIGTYSEYGCYDTGYVEAVGKDPDIQKILDKWLIMRKNQKRFQENQILEKLQSKNEKITQKKIANARKYLGILLNKEKKDETR